jgi:hypothetical protein
MQYWMKNSSSVEAPYTQDDWKSQRGALWPTVNFPRSKRPSARRGDRMFWHAIGSAGWLGDGVFSALGEVSSDEPTLTEHPQWPWALDVTILAEVPLLSQAPRLGDVDVSLRSLRRQSYIKMSDAQGRHAERLLLAAASDVP